MVNKTASKKSGRASKPKKRAASKAKTAKKAPRKKAPVIKKAVRRPKPKPRPRPKTKVKKVKKTARKPQTHRAKTVHKIDGDDAEQFSARRGKGAKKNKTFIKIKVVGVGGGGGNAITRMRGEYLARGVEFVAMNTDIQDLESCDAHRKLHIGKNVTKGMGAGMDPDLGQQAAEESREEIAEALAGADIVFITAGFGGGTGTGATPVVAEVAREMNILTVSIITKPFSFEGTTRMKIAEDGVMRIKDKVDTLLIIPNDRIFGIIDKNTPVLKAFEKIDGILKSAVQGVAEIIASSGLINVDFADVRTIMADSGLAVIGVGNSGGADRAIKAVNQAINSPLLDISIDGARGVLFGISGGRDMTMSEINEAAKIVTDSVDPSAKIIFGAYNDRKLKAGNIKIILIATGFNGMTFRRDYDSLPLFSGDIDFEKSGGSTRRPDKNSEQVSGSGGGKGKKSDSNAPHDGGSRHEDDEKDEDFWDTPTFLRKKGR